jgi:hypothetical protein
MTCPPAEGKSPGINKPDLRYQKKYYRAEQLFAYGNELTKAF